MVFKRREIFLCKKLGKQIGFQFKNYTDICMLQKFSDTKYVTLYIGRYLRTFNITS